MSPYLAVSNTASYSGTLTVQREIIHFLKEAEMPGSVFTCQERSLNLLVLEDVLKEDDFSS